MSLPLTLVPQVPSRENPLPASAIRTHATPPAVAPPLRLVFWETTTACNLACIHCRRLEVSAEMAKNDLSHEDAKAFIRSVKDTGNPILVFSGGEPLSRPDWYELGCYARDIGLMTALATNGTMVDDAVAKRIVDAGFKRVSMSFDGPDADTHDQFRGAGAFDQSIAGFEALRRVGMSMQINTTVAKHNHKKLDETYALSLALGADALHVFMLVPVGCGMSLDESVMLNGQDYEDALNWIYDRSLEGKLHLKATCAPHYFRVMRQRAKADGKPMPAFAHPHKNMKPQTLPSQGAPQAAGPTGGHPAHPQPNGAPHDHRRHEMTAMTKGCLAGQAICFVSHTGEVFPCGYLPVTSGNVKNLGLPKIWHESGVFADLRADDTLEGKCGLCEYAKVCMGCRARAFSETQNYLAEEPNCDHIPVRTQRQNLAALTGKTTESSPGAIA